MQAKSKKFITSAVSVMATAVLIAGMCVMPRIIRNTDISEAVAPEVMQDFGSELNIEESQSNGISLMAAKIEPEEYSDYGIEPQAESAYTITATVYPEDATDKSLEWSLAWDQTARNDEGNLYYTNEDWYSIYDEEYDEWVDYSTPALASIGITEEHFITVTALNADKTKVQLTCIERFGCPINITCTAQDGSGVSATCRVDLERIASFKYPERTYVRPLPNSNAVDRISCYTGYSLGTIKQSQYQIEEIIVQPTDWYSLGASRGIYFPYGAFTDGSDFYGDWETKNGYMSYTINMSWDSFCDMYMSDNNNYTYDTDFTESQKQANRDAARRLLQALSDEGILKTTPIFYLTIYASNTSTGKTECVYCYVYINDISQIPIYSKSVSSITLPDSIVL